MDREDVHSETLRAIFGGLTPKRSGDREAGDFELMNDADEAVQEAAQVTRPSDPR